MEGFFIIHPRAGYPGAGRPPLLIFLQEWRSSPGTYTPDPNVMTDFNIFYLNSRVWPGTDPLQSLGWATGCVVSFANLSMDSHPIHFHGHRWWLVGTDGGEVPRSASIPETTIHVPPGTTRTVEFVADNPGDWATFIAIRITHAMNAMSHAIPNVVGADQKDVARENRQTSVPGYSGHGETGCMKCMQ